MNANHYKQQKHFKIYAILLSAEDNFCFIGKTSSPRLSAAYHRHRRGEIAATAGWFSEENEIPKLYLLEEMSVSTALAYKRVLAWIHLFMSNGYYVINHEKSIIQAKNLKEDTKRIVEELSKEPLSQILLRTYLDSPTSGDTSPPPVSNKQSPEPKSFLSVRLSNSEKQHFLDFCQQNKLSQKQGIFLLLDYASEDHYQKNIGEQLSKNADQIQKLKSENTALRERLRAATTSKEDILSSYIEFLKTGLQQYFADLFPVHTTTSILKPISYYRHLMQERSIHPSHIYPEDDGFMFIHLQKLVWGRSKRRALFVLGMDDNKRLYRFRYYPKDFYLGYPLNGSPYAYEGARWFVGFRRAKDGAMDLIAAFPATVAAMDDPRNKPADYKERESLDAQIKRAASRI